MTVVLDHPEQLDLTTYRHVVTGDGVELAPDALARVAAGHASLLELLAGGAGAYGVNTGLGYLSGTEIAPGERAGLRRALVTARAAGIEARYDTAVIRGVMLLRLNAFLSGVVGVSTELCDFLAARLNDGWDPVVPRGPYGAAGEISALAHLFQTFVGEGLVGDGPAAAALAERGVAPFELGPKEGLALVNGSPFATALGLELGARFRALLDTATTAAALAVALTGSSARPYAPQVARLARDPAQATICDRLSQLLDGEEAGADLPQPPVSFRVVPQVHGAALDAVERLEEQLERRLGAVTDTPLVLDEGDSAAGLYPTGGFHAAAPVLLLDTVGMAAAHVLNLVEKRLHRLLDSRFSGLPEQLSIDSGRHAGVVALHKAVVGLAVEGRLLAAPASVHALDTSAGQEDVQTFTFLSAERLERSLDALESALAYELVALRQAAFVRKRPLSAPALAAIVDRLSEQIEPVDDDRTLSGDVEIARSLVRGNRVRTSPGP
jgi:histidine ammonia-lyase